MRERRTITRVLFYLYLEYFENPEVNHKASADPLLNFEGAKRGGPAIIAPYLLIARLPDQTPFTAQCNALGRHQFWLVELTNKVKGSSFISHLSSRF
jgi:hypothetical protein